MKEFRQNIGKRIKHPKFGNGKVIDLLYHEVFGYSYIIQFEGTLTVGPDRLQTNKICILAESKELDIIK